MKLLGLAAESATKLEVSLPKGLGGFDTLLAGFHGNVPVKTLSLVGGKQRGCERLKGSRKGIRSKKYRAR